MPIRKILEYPAQILLEPALPVTKFDSELSQLVGDMFETMYEARGVGLAAPQIGVALRLFVIDCDGVKLAAANPHIVSQDGEQDGQEGCLSLGSLPAKLSRPMNVVLRGQDTMGKPFEILGTGPSARCFVHEIDHCNGILFISHLSPLTRDLIKRRFMKSKRNGRSPQARES